MNSGDFRAALRRFPTGVTVVTTMLDDRPKGFTATAFASVSAEPPMVLVCVNRLARTHPLIAQAGRFCVNILSLEQRELAVRFSARAPADPFAGLEYRVERSGAPVLDGVLAFLDCELAEEHSAGTHTVFLGRVLACGSGAGAPLGYFNKEYRDFACTIP